MGYLTGTDSESVGSAVRFEPGILAVLNLHKQTENHFCSHEGKQEKGGRVNPPEGSRAHRGSCIQVTYIALQWGPNAVWLTRCNSSPIRCLNYFSLFFHQANNIKHHDLKQGQNFHRAPTVQSVHQCPHLCLSCSDVLQCHRCAKHPAVSIQNCFCLKKHTSCTNLQASMIAIRLMYVVSKSDCMISGSPQWQSAASWVKHHY